MQIVLYLELETGRENFQPVKWLSKENKFGLGTWICLFILFYRFLIGTEKILRWAKEKSVALEYFCSGSIFFSRMPSLFFIQVLERITISYFLSIFQIMTCFDMSCSQVFFRTCKSMDSWIPSLNISQNSPVCCYLFSNLFSQATLIQMDVVLHLIESTRLWLSCSWSIPLACDTPRLAMARLLFPALSKLDAENGRLRSRVVALEAELQEKTSERIQFHRVWIQKCFKCIYASLKEALFVPLPPSYISCITNNRYE